MSKKTLGDIKGCLKGRVVLVVSAAPSSAKWSEVYKSISGQAPVVACIKQAVEIEGLNSICDIHFINPYNLKKYKYKNKPLVIFSGAVDAPRVFNDYDLKMNVCKNKNANLSETLASKLNFDDHLFEKSGIVRPWGPGIMYESVFYTLLHMGAKKIITVGWDIADSKGGNKHFYDKKSIVDIVDYFFRQMCSRFRISIIYNWVSYSLGRKYNHAGMVQGEAEVTSKSVPHIQSWLLSKGTELQIISDSKWMKL